MCIYVVHSYILDFYILLNLFYTHYIFKKNLIKFMNILPTIIIIGFVLLFVAFVIAWVHFSTEAEYAAGAKLRKIVDQKRQKNKL